VGRDSDGELEVTPDAGISVVVAVRNGAPSIQQCLWSILRQTASCPLEIIVVDDASTDDTRSQVTAIADSRVRLVELAENQGVSAARNIGVAAASHAWVAFNDHDDVWLPDKLELQLQLLRAVPTAGGCVRGEWPAGCRRVVPVAFSSV
jgi:glycosyltransferase involved in cell wall biosynthesis